MELIGSPNNDYQFDDLELASPQAMQGGGAYFAKILQGENHPIIQFPRCTTKSGIVFTKRTTYLDLMFDRDQHLDIVSWSEKLVDKACSLIDEKKALWFSNDLTTDEIENMCNSIHRDYKSGTKILIRASIDTHRGNNDLKCKIYDENEKIVLDTSAVEDKITGEIIPLVSIDGIKFTARSIDIELKVKQIMLMESDRSASPACLIKRTSDKIDIKALPIEKESSDDSESLVNPDSVNTEAAIADDGVISSSNEELQPLEEIKIDNPDELEEVNISHDEPEDNLSDSEDDDNETQTSNTVSESQALETNSVGLEEVTLGDLSDFPDPDKNNAITEVNIELNEAEEAMKLKKPNEVYYQIYRNAKLKAKQMRKAAVEAYLEAKQIKTKYMLDDLDDSDDEDLDLENLST
jgi:hypothetical protein